MGGFDPRLKIAEDWDLWLRMAFQNKIPRMNAILTYNFVTRGSLSQNRLEKYLYDLEVLKKWQPCNQPQISPQLYRNWCNAMVINRLLKLRHRCGQKTAHTFWKTARKELPLSPPVTLLGEIMTKHFFGNI
jgi:hypothetical protein